MQILSYFVFIITFHILLYVLHAVFNILINYCAKLIKKDLLVMKKYVLNKIEKAIRKQYASYDEDKIEVIMYGIEGLYITITKCIIIFSIALILGIFKELLLLLLFFNLIRLFAFGMHAPNGTVCLVISALLFIGITYLVSFIKIPLYILITIYIFALISMILFSPADTVKRPLIKRKKRILYKTLSIIITISYFVLCILLKDKTLINSMTFGLLIECILINPITYKVFKLPYNNYKNYGLNV